VCVRPAGELTDHADNIGVGSQLEDVNSYTPILYVCAIYNVSWLGFQRRGRSKTFNTGVI
jgi:hypothetical protein